MTFAFLFYFKDFPLTFLSIFSEYLFFSKCFVFVFTFAVESGFHVHQASIKSHIIKDVIQPPILMQGLHVCRLTTAACLHAVLGTKHSFTLAM